MEKELVVLRCVRSHTILWPRDLMPYPIHCFSDVDFAYCRQELRVMGYATFTSKEETSPNNLLEEERYLPTFPQPEPI